MPTPALYFVALLAAVTATRLWLLRRQRRAVLTHRARVPEEFAAEVPQTAHEKAADYSVARIRVAALDVLIEAAVALLITLGGGLAWIDALLRTNGFRGVALGLLVIGALAAASALAGLPLSLYRTFVVETRFGFNRTTWTLYLMDHAKGVALAVVLGAPLLAVVLWLMNRAGDAWWLYAWAVWFTFSVVLLWAYPAFIAPWFNRFQPLADESLRARVEDIVARCGFSSRGVFVMDGSRRSSHGNAYFTGFGASKRIVLFDTLIERLAGDEVEAVLAHELGHYRLHHIRKRLLLSALAGFAGLACLGWLARTPAFYSAFAIAAPSPHAALVLFSIGAPLATFWLSPLASAWSRGHEFEADAFAAQRVDSRSLAHALVKLYKDNATTLTPDRIYSSFYDSHPPARRRIARLLEAHA
jgi:STE24 endopeptidase